MDTLARLEATIAARRTAAPDESYVAQLRARGLPVIARKLGEEAVEAVIAALSGSDEELTKEAADVLFHLMVLLAEKGIPLEAVLAELDRREGTSGLAEKAARGELMPVDTSLPYDDQNVFAKILRGEIPSTRVYEDDWAYAFPDIRPEAPVHILVIPKGAYVGWDDFTAKASEAEIAGFMRAVGEVARQQGVAEPGYRLLVRVGTGGGQEIPHLHVHVLAGKPVEK